MKIFTIIFWLSLLLPYNSFATRYDIRTQGYVKQIAGAGIQPLFGAPKKVISAVFVNPIGNSPMIIGGPDVDLTTGNGIILVAGGVLGLDDVNSDGASLYDLSQFYVQGTDTDELQIFYLDQAQAFN